MAGSTACSVKAAPIDCSVVMVMITSTAVRTGILRVVAPEPTPVSPSRPTSVRRGVHGAGGRIMTPGMAGGHFTRHPDLTLGRRPYTDGPGKEDVMAGWGRPRTGRPRSCQTARGLSGAVERVHDVLPHGSVRVVGHGLDARNHIAFRGKDLDARDRLPAAGTVDKTY